MKMPMNTVSNEDYDTYGGKDMLINMTWHDDHSSIRYDEVCSELPLIW